MRPQIRKSDILYFDDQLMVINKPAGILSQPDKSKEKDLVELLKGVLGKDSPDFLATVHRLDRNTSGAILLACNTKSAATLGNQIKEGLIDRTYHAIVRGIPKGPGIVNIPISKDPETNQSKVDLAEGKDSVTNFKVLKKFSSTSLLEVSLESGRSHQIRVHLSHIGHELLGDTKYGTKTWAKLFWRPALHAKFLKFTHPQSKEEFEIEANYPDDFVDLLKRLSAFTNSRNS